MVHKDYSVNTAIQISIYPNKLMLWNPGQLPENWTLEKLLTKHESIPYNPDIANAFFRAGLIESWGRGIERIVETCQKESYPTPEWKVEPNGLWVIFTFETPEEQQETVDCGRLRSIAVDYGRLKYEEVSIIKFLEEHNKITRQQAEELLGLQRTKIMSIINKLIEAKILERQGGGPNTFYQLKIG